MLSSSASTDPLAHVLAAAGARGVRRTRLEAAGEWGLAFPARQRLKLVALLRGTCWVLPAGQARQPMTPGDVYLIGAVDYAVASAPHASLVDGSPLYAAPDRDLARVGGDDTVLLGGGLVFSDERAGFLLDALPTFMKIDRSSPSAAAVAAILQLLDREVEHARLGGAAVSERLAEILLVETLRAYAAERGDDVVGWVGALGDRHLGAALRLMHGELDHPWTVGELASRVGMSRAAFALRFRQRVGLAPLEYLTHRRLWLARELLRDRERTVAAVAEQVGYTSQSAFGHAFRRAFGHSPRQEGDG